MKRYPVLIALVLILLFPVVCWGAAPGTVTQARANYPESGTREIVFTCTGSVDDGSIPATDTSASNTAFIKGYQLYEVCAYPTSGGTAPDAANVFVKHKATGIDLLGSEDGATAYEGLNLIHATLTRCVTPSQYSPRAGVHLSNFPYVYDTLTLSVAGQATVSANWTIVLKFWREKR